MHTPDHLSTQLRHLEILLFCHEERHHVLSADDDLGDRHNRAAITEELDPQFGVGQSGSLLLYLSEYLVQFRVFDWQKDVSWTNNGSEWVIGRMKMSSRTVRGYKSESGMLKALMVTSSRVC